MRIVRSSLSVLVVVPVVLVAFESAQPAGAQLISLEAASNLQLHNVTAQSVTYKGRKAVRIAASGAENLSDGARLAVLPGTDFEDGVIEIELAGDTQPGAPPEYRGFTGVAFRVSPDASRYECFYLRPKNGRSEDQAQRNHSAEYISIPEFPWRRLRQEFPAKYESYVDLVPGEWTKVKVKVKGRTALLFVNGSEQPTLIVNDLKHGNSKGAIALWVDPRTVAHFAELHVVR